MSVPKYPLSMRIFHWTVSVLVIFMLALGLALANGLDKTANGPALVGLHKSIGVLILLLVVGRLLNRIAHKDQVPPYAPTMPFYERWAAWVVHRLLYLCLFVIPLSGYMMSSYSPKSSGVAFFGIPLPIFVEKNEELAKAFFEIHETTSFILIGLLVLHLAGVIKHRFFDKPEHDSLSKML